eukprot:1187105-Prorocentrum_minimum.AAC.5
MEALRAPSEAGKGPLELHPNYPTPVLRPGFVCVQVSAASLNFADALQLQGLYQERPKLPYVPGGEVSFYEFARAERFDSRATCSPSGVVAEIGEGVQGLTVGAPVCALCGLGAFAEYAVVDARTLVPLPPHISTDRLQRAAGLPVAFGTAHLALEVLSRQPYTPNAHLHIH